MAEEADGRKRIQAAMHEAQQKNLLLLQRYPIIEEKYKRESIMEFMTNYMYQARVDKLKSTYGENNPSIQAQLSDMVFTALFVIVIIVLKTCV